jgi:hypothetical protein
MILELLIPGLILTVLAIGVYLVRIVKFKSKASMNWLVLILMLHFLVYFTYFILSIVTNHISPSEFLRTGGWGNILRMQALITFIALEVYHIIREEVVKHAA